MRKVKKVLKWFLFIVLIVIITGMIFPTWTPKIKGKNSISELKQIEINGAKHGVMIRGEDVNNPIIIYIHGGPGVSEMPYIAKYQDLLEKNFTIVNYDQRGTGKSYHFFEDYSDLSSERIVDDLLKLTDYISERFNKEKVILAGHSWGSLVGIKAVAQAPEKYSVYIGIGQVANIHESEIDSLNYCLVQAQKMVETEDISKLKELRTKIETGSAFTPRRYIRKYGGAARLIDDRRELKVGFYLRPEYNLLDRIRYERGIFRAQKPLLEEILSNSLPESIKSLKIPFYFVMGKYDYMTSAEASRDFFKMIEAPEKEFVMFKNSAHYPHFEEKVKFSQWLTDKFAE